MNIKESPKQGKIPNDLFKKYGIEFLEDGSIHGPKRPEQFGKTPKFFLKKI